MLLSPQTSRCRFCVYVSAPLVTGKEKGPERPGSLQATKPRPLPRRQTLTVNRLEGEEQKKMKGFSSSQRRQRRVCAAAVRPGARGASPPASQRGGDIPGSDGPVAEETRLISTKPRWLKARVGMGGEPRGEFIHSSQKIRFWLKIKRGKSAYCSPLEQEGRCGGYCSTSSGSCGSARGILRPLHTRNTVGLIQSRPQASAGPMQKAGVRGSCSPSRF